MIHTYRRLTYVQLINNGEAKIMKLLILQSFTSFMLFLLDTNIPLRLLSPNTVLSR